MENFEKDKEEEELKSRKVKRMLALAVTGAVCVSALGACGSSSDSGKSESTESSDSGESSGGSGDLVMAWWGNQVRNEKTQEALDKYKELNGVSVEGQFYQWNDYWSKMATAAAGNSMPDLIQMDYSYIEQYVDNGQLLDLTPYMESGALDVSNIPENVLAMGEVGDGNYGIAAGVSGNCLFYNKTVTDELGITMTDNMSFDEFVEIAKQITEETGYRANVLSQNNYFTEWSRAEGIPIVEAKLPVASADEYTPFYQIMEDSIKDGWQLTPDYIDTTAVETDPMVYGSSPETMAWCTINGTSNQLTAFQSAAPEGTEIAVTTIPTTDTVTSNYLKPALYFSISADTEDPDAAVALLDYLINSEDANGILLGERGVPASTSIADYIYDLVSETEQKSFAYVTDVITPNCSPINPPDPTGMSELTDTMKKVAEKIGYGEATAAEAAQEVYDKGIELWGE